MACLLRRLEGSATHLAMRLAGDPRSLIAAGLVVTRSFYGSGIMSSSTRLTGEKKSGEHFAITKGMVQQETRGATQVIVKHPNYNVRPAEIIENTSHRDGSIYKKQPALLEIYRLTDRAETRLEPMMLSEPTNCYPDREKCVIHFASHMLQIFSLKLSKIPIGHDSVQLYGYIAVRDHKDSLLNYIVKHSRDDPIILQQGSFIEMTGPKRGISMCSAVMIEFDMRIKKGEQEEDDLQLIDGASEYSSIFTRWMPFISRINGDCGAVDITLAHVYNAVEATIEVVISEMQGGFNLSLSSFVLITGHHVELHEEIRLFHGTVSEPCGLRRVIAVEMDSWMHLKFKVGKKGFENDVEHYCYFKANNHGCAGQEIFLELALISVKVTWSTLRGI